MSNAHIPRRLGILVGGGPAPGINGVISAATIEAIEQGSEVFGFKDGFKWLVRGSTEHFRKLTIEEVKGVHNRGGSILGTARTNPAKNQQDMARVLEVFRKFGLDALITIGGDDTAFSGSQVYQQAGGSIRVAHVPKTIDNDLPLPASTPTFGFETARHFGTHIVRNIAEDARTTSRWYIIVSMGRAAGHLALGIGKAAAATLTLIPEEFVNRPVKLEQVCEIILGSIIKRLSMGANHGVAILAEGLIEAIGEQGLQSLTDSGQLGRYGKIARDEHNHLRLGEIEFGRMIKDRLAQMLEEVGLSVGLVDKDLGYELRCADPIPFDAEYTRDLGYGAVKFLCNEDSTRFGAIISFEGGKLRPMPFDEMINPKTGRMLPRKVNISSESYEVARNYMIRLETRDFEDAEKLAHMARIAKMSESAFRERFAPAARFPV
jgi:ATP-dependent phosphofructokinase / diphosphate-dependent phosphofructokinase